MNAPKLLTVAAAVALTTLVGSTAFAQPPRHQSDEDNQYVNVMVTGSIIPQTVRIKAIGTTTTAPIRVFDRHEIDQTGAFNTEDVLRHDPSIKVHGFGQSGPSN